MREKYPNCSQTLRLLLLTMLTTAGAGMSGCWLVAAGAAGAGAGYIAGQEAAEDDGDNDNDDDDE